MVFRERLSRLVKLVAMCVIRKQWKFYCKPRKKYRDSPKWSVGPRNVEVKTARFLPNVFVHEAAKPASLISVASIKDITARTSISRMKKLYWSLTKFLPTPSPLLMANWPNAVRTGKSPQLLKACPFWGALKLTIEHVNKVWYRVCHTSHRLRWDCQALNGELREVAIDAFFP